ncbi:MAG: FadR/GntR family transcriptional regulator [Hyphomonadaceae bacterium]
MKTDTTLRRAEPGAPAFGLQTSVRKQKLCEHVAKSIISDIAESGWRPGEVLGTEVELLQRYGVSRATFREAVRQVELHGAASMRRGAGGGLIVNAPPRNAAVRAIMTFFELTRVSFGEQQEVREQLEITAARLASDRLTKASATALRSAVTELEATPESQFEDNIARNMGVRVAVAEATQNPAMPLFIEALNGVLRDILGVLRFDEARFIRDRELSGRYKQVLVSAILAKDADRAEALVRQDIQRRLLDMSSGLKRPTVSHEADRKSSRIPSWWQASGAPLKLSERTAFAIVDDIERAGWKEVESLGNETALQERYSVSRAVLREAVRQLELHGIVNIRSGMKGGLYIGRVDSTYTEEVVCTYLRSTRIAMIHLWETESVLATFATERVAERAKDDDKKVFKAHLARVEKATTSDYISASTALHAEIADRTGNRVLSLFYRLLLRYGLDTMPRVKAADLPWLTRMHVRLIDAICANDSAEARRLMTRLFTQSRAWVSGK